MPGADWSVPSTLATPYADVLQEFKDRDVDSITLQKSAPSNLPVGAIAWDRATNKFKEWNGASFDDLVIALGSGGTGANTAAGARTSLGLGSMAVQDASAVAITGGAISGVTMNASVLTAGQVSLARGGTGASLAIGANGYVLQSNGAVVGFGNDGSQFINLAADQLSSGVAPLARIPSLPASQITSGVIAQARLGSGSGGLGTKALYDDQTYKVIDFSTLYPVGSVYINAAVATNPGTLLGFGTWVAIGTGRVLVGLDGAQTEFDTLAKTGGFKTHTLTVAELAVHTHVQDPHIHSNKEQGISDVGGGTLPLAMDGGAGLVSDTVRPATATNQNAGSGNAHNNLQPYIVVYMWQRTV